MVTLLTLSIKKDDPQPIYVQIYQQIRELILTGRLGAEMRLPSSRALASELEISRSTIVTAYEQLLSEGYVRATRGAGIFVMPLSPDHLLHVRSPDDLKTRNSTKSESPDRSKPKPFEIDTALFELFPAKDWTRRLAASWRREHPDLLSFHDPFGHMPLRDAISSHLSLWRGFECAPENIIITSGASDAMDLIFRTMAHPGDDIWMEDPGYEIIRHGIRSNGMNAIPVPLDEAGFDLGIAKEIAPKAKIAIVTPSRQFPFGTIMSLTRRLELLDWAHHSGGWIVEDDYDSEYRYEGRPFPAMAGLDEHSNTLYLGSFSKVMFRSLRLAYLVCPPRLIERFREIIAKQGTKASFVAQPALADFMESGAFGAHIRKTRRVYAKRLTHLQAALSSQAEGLLVAPPQTSGLHLVARLDDKISDRMTDRDIVEAAKNNDIRIQALSDYYQNEPIIQGLVMGFAGHNETAIDEGVSRLVASIKSLLS